MPVYTGTVDGETIGSYPVLADNERIVNVEYFYHYPQHMNPFEPNPFQYNFYRITTEYYTSEVRKDASYYHGALAGTSEISGGSPLGHYNRIPISISPSEFAKLLSPGKRRLPSSLMKGGKKRFILDSYKPRRGKSCRLGYQLINGMCVKY